MNQNMEYFTIYTVFKVLIKVRLQSFQQDFKIVIDIVCSSLRHDCLLLCTVL